MFYQKIVFNSDSKLTQMPTLPSIIITVIESKRYQWALKQHLWQLAIFSTALIYLLNHTKSTANHAVIITNNTQLMNIHNKVKFPTIKT